MDALKENDFTKRFLGLRNTAIIITHNLKSLEKVDKIVYLKDGAILATGDHFELLEKCCEYRNMYFSLMEGEKHEKNWVFDC